MNQRTKLAASTIAILLLAGCSSGAPVPLKTQPAPLSACDDALGTGTLVETPLSGLGIRLADGSIQGVEWPFEYTATRDVTGVSLLDSAGAVVAHEGQVIQMSGGTRPDKLFHACPGSIAVVPAPN